MDAHTPHDAIDALHISPTYETDSTLYLIVQNRLLRSIDAGSTWLQLTNGLDSPYLLSDIAISPDFAEDELLYVSTDGGGVYSSSDQGRTWQHFNQGLRQPRIGLLRVSGAKGRRKILAAGATRGLFASDTKEAGWHRVMSDDVQITSLSMLNMDDDSVAIAGDANGGLWKSSEELDDWQRVMALPNVGAITAIASWPTAGSDVRLYVGTEASGILRIEQWGESIKHLSDTWPAREFDCKGRPLGQSSLDSHVRDIEVGVSDTGERSIYVTTATRAMYMSSDEGVTWQMRNEGTTCDDQADSRAFGVPHFRDVEIGGGNNKHFFVAGFDGLYRSDDSGLTWEQLETLPISLIRGLNVSPALNGRHALALTTYGGGAYVSLDAGRSFATANTGLVSTRLADIEFSPGFWHDGSMFSLSMRRLLTSRAADKGWTANTINYRGLRRKVGVGLERHLGFSTKFGSELFLSDLERRTVWPMQIELSPAFEEDRTLFVGSRQHGVWVSNNAGEDWNRDWVGPTDYVTALQISPSFADDRTVFAGIRGAGVYVTRNGGKSWSEANSGLEWYRGSATARKLNYINDPPLQRAINDVALMVSPNFSNDQTVFASSVGGFFRSTNSGRDWSNLTVNPSLKNVPITAIAMSPNFADDQMILVSYKGRGLYRSIDGGQTFDAFCEQPLPANFDLKYIRFSPAFAEDATVYGATEESVWQSRDGGYSWRVLDRPIRYEDWRGGSLGPVRFIGNWRRESSATFSASTQTVSDEQGAYASLRFFGSNVVWVGERGPSGGQADVFIDDEHAATVDLYNSRKIQSDTLLRMSDLERASHVIRIELRGDKNTEATGSKISIDRFEIKSTARFDSEVWH